MTDSLSTARTTDKTTCAKSERASRHGFAMRCWPWSLLLLVGLVGLSGCAERGTASLNGDLQVGNCEALAQKTPWQLESRYVTLAVLGSQKTPLSVELRIQMHPGSLTQRGTAPQDVLVLRISNPLLIKTGQVIPIEAYEARLVAEPPGSDTTRVVARAIFSLGQTCPTLPHPNTYALQGQVTFNDFALTTDAPIAGNVTLQIGPARPSSAAANGTVQGTFQLTYRPPNALGDDEVGYQPSP